MHDQIIKNRFERLESRFLDLRDEFADADDQARETSRLATAIETLNKLFAGYIEQTLGIELVDGEMKEKTEPTDLVG